MIWRRLPAVPLDGGTAAITGNRGSGGKDRTIVKEEITAKRHAFLKVALPVVQGRAKWLYPVGSERNQDTGHVTPPLAGPAEIKLNACVIDPWGLSQIKFEISPVKLVAIPELGMPIGWPENT